jgi:ribonucleoside-diphosphate reductase alpha chain
MNLYQEFIHKSRYARYLPELKRRESWKETVDRYMNCIHSQCCERGYMMIRSEWFEIYNAILNLRVMPSMRLLMTAGEAVERDNICAYNCAYTAISSPSKFSESLHILMNGTGIGFSCERQEIAKLPVVPENFFTESNELIVVGDSKEGWAAAFALLIGFLYSGLVPTIDYSLVRPHGARLKTFGGRASGPAPLKRLFEYCIGVFKYAAGRRLTSIEVHDIMCMIGEIVVVGGVRRSALISLSNLSDLRMREAKFGAWWETNGQRALSNNSVCYTEKPTCEAFMQEWVSLMISKSGERGIFNRVAAQKLASRMGRDPDADYGCNPCSEIILKPNEFCNLTEVVVRAMDKDIDLSRKVRIATILGTIQSTFTDFKFLGDEWKTNCEDERLLGVSLTGIMDNLMLNGSGDKETTEFALQVLRRVARETNIEWAAKLGINVSKAITCVKPSGTVAQLTGAGTGGIHPRYSKYYVRTVRQDNKDPLTEYLKACGVPWEVAAGREGTTVFSFPVISPDGCVMRNDRSALQQLEHWLIFARHWCEHKPSVTIYVKDDEWLEVGAWVFKHFDEVSGISFLPHTNHNYVQAPFQEIGEGEYLKRTAAMPVSINWEGLVEADDETVGSQELACGGGGCIF